MNHKDVVVVGAGISGIGAAYNLQKTCPPLLIDINLRYVIV